MYVHANTRTHAHTHTKSHVTALKLIVSLGKSWFSADCIHVYVLQFNDALSSSQFIASNKWIIVNIELKSI